MGNAAVFEFSGDAKLSIDDARELPQGSSGHVDRISWSEVPAPQPTIYHVAVSCDDQGATTAYCVELPGAITEAEDKQSACEQLRDAIGALVEEYRAMGMAVPYQPRPVDEGFVIYDAISVNA